MEVELELEPPHATARRPAERMVATTVGKTKGRWVCP